MLVGTVIKHITFRKMVGTVFIGDVRVIMEGTVNIDVAFVMC